MTNDYHWCVIFLKVVDARAGPGAKHSQKITKLTKITTKVKEKAAKLRRKRMKEFTNKQQQEQSPELSDNAEGICYHLLMI